MKSITYRGRYFILLVAALSLLPLGPGGAVAVEKAAPDQIRSLIERAQIPATEKTELLNAADRSLQAGVPADDVEIIITRARDREIDAKTTRELLDTIVKVREKDLPMRPVLNRIQQGLSKGVSPERISAASNKLAEKLAEAQPIVGDLVRGGVKAGKDRDREYAIETVARALEKSMPEEMIVRTGARVKERRGSVALFDKAVHTMTRLTESGMPVESASRLVHSALGKGFSEKDLTKMERDVVEGLEKGKRMEDVVKSQESEIKQDGKSDGRSEKRDGRSEQIRDEKSGGSRGPGSDRIRDLDRGGKTRELDRDR